MAFSTTAELAQHAERELGHNLGSSASSQRTDIVSHLDRSHKIVLAGGGFLNQDTNGKRLRNEVAFSFARSKNPKILTLRPAITDATLTATRDSTTITFDAVPDGTNSVANSFIRINGEGEVYRIATHTANTTSATLDAVYVGSANVSTAASSIFQLHYDVGSSDILQLISPIRSFARTRQDNEISLVDKDELVSQYPQADIFEESPACAAIVLESAGTVTLQMNSYPPDLERVEVEYIPIPSTLDTTNVNPIIPAQYRVLLSHLTVYFMSLRNDDARAAAHLQIARDMFSELVEWNDKLTSSGDPDFGRIRIAGTPIGKAIRVVRPYTISN